MPVPNVYKLGGSNLSASFDWKDFVSSVGYVDYNATTTSMSGGDLDFLAVNKLYTVNYTSGANTMAGGPPFTLQAEKDFDLQYQNPVIVQGNLISNCTFYIYKDGGGTANGYLQYYIYRVDLNGTETLIGSGQSANRAIVGAAYYRELLNIPLIRTHFGIGEKLRLNVQLWCYSVGGGAGASAGRFYFDPQDTLASPDTNLLVSVPYKIDL